MDIAALVSEHHATLYRYAYRLCGTQADAEDLVQQTFLIAHERIHQLRSADRARAWLYAVLRTCFLKSKRKTVPIDATTLQLDVETIGQEPTELGEFDVEQLQTALNELPDEARLIVTMFYFENASYKEIAAQLDIKIGTVMSRLARAKEKLRRRLANPALVR